MAFTSSEAFEFPKFSDGTVAVVITKERVYHLHQWVLRRFSPVFAGLLADGYAAKLSDEARSHGASIRFRVDLLGLEGGDCGRFERRVSDTANELRPFGSYKFSGD